jgi:hypothetical protein
MRTSLNNIARTEARLLGRLQPADALLFDARLLLDDGLQADASAQKQVYTLVTTIWPRTIKAGNRSRT